MKQFKRWRRINSRLFGLPQERTSTDLRSLNHEVDCSPVISSSGGPLEQAQYPTHRESACASRHEIPLSDRKQAESAMGVLRPFPDNFPVSKSESGKNRYWTEEELSARAEWRML